MKDPVRRDTILTVVGMTLMVAFFLVAVYLPGQRACDAARAEIQASERAVTDVPLRVAELEKLNADLQIRQDYLHQITHRVPDTPNVHGVISDVATLARQHHLTVTRLEPLQSVTRETIAVQPFRLSLSGGFSDFVSFLHGVESCDRLYRIESLKVLRKDEGTAATMQCDVDFSVFSGRAENADSAENNASGNFALADKK